MTAKSYLKRLRQLENAIRTMRAELFRIRQKTESPGSVKYTAARVQYTAGDKLESNVIHLMTIEEAIQDKLAEYEETRAKIVNEILSLPDPKHQKVLYSVYVEGLPLFKTARKLNYSVSHVKRVHAAALAAFAVQMTE